MAFTAGQRIRASELNQIGKVVGRNARTTNTTSAPGPYAVLSVRAPVVAGRSYLCTLQCESFGSVADNVAQHELRHTTNDVEPTTSSAVLFRSLVGHRLVGIPQSVTANGIFDCTATGFLRVLHTVFRASGSGNVAISASAAGPEILTVEDIGDTIASSGTVY